MIEIVYPGYSDSSHYWDDVNSFASLALDARNRSKYCEGEIVVRQIRGMTVIAHRGHLVRDKQ